MDIWLLATQLLLGAVAAPQAARRNPPSVNTVAVMPADAEDDLAMDQEPLAPTAVVPTRATMAPQASSSADPPPVSMTAVVNRWPRPEAMTSPVRPALPQPRPPSRPPASGGLKPVTGSQLYQFRTAALQTGQLYTQLAPLQYRDQWQRVADSPTHDQWQALLAQEAEMMARTQGERSLTVLVGDSLGLWLPLDDLPPSQLWLNQSISGETTTHMLRRLHYFAATQPRSIHIMAGINDLKTGATETQVVDNLDQIIARLKQQHPQARLVVYSILPTRLHELPSDRIQRVNRQLATLTAAQAATFIDLHPAFSDDQGQLRPELTTDGLHLSPQGYTLWRAALVSH
jgi:lysophospholipase L1-like esterase